MSTAGTINVDKVFYKLDITHAFQQVLVVSDDNQPGDKIIVADLEGEILFELTRSGPRTPPEEPRNVTEDLTHQMSPMS